MNSTMTYDKLYNNMVKKFTVEKDNTEYSLGDYMLMKAQSKKNALTTAESTALTAKSAHEHKYGTLAAVFSYINDKLTVKEAPVRNKTMRSFPLRTSLTALCSALIVCGLVISCCLFGVSNSAIGNDNTIITEIEEDTHEETLLSSPEFENI